MKNHMEAYGSPMEAYLRPPGACAISKSGASSSVVAAAAVVAVAATWRREEEEEDMETVPLLSLSLSLSIDFSIAGNLCVYDSLSPSLL
jgi:pyruvate/2-oxoglutarate/acetoin dehydrogenase E1 component